MVQVPRICHGHGLYVETERRVDNVRRLSPSHSRKKEDSSRKETSLYIEMPETALVVANSERASAAPHQKGHVPDERMLRKRGLIQGRKPRLLITLNKISDYVISNAFPGGSRSYK